MTIDEKPIKIYSVQSDEPSTLQASQRAHWHPSHAITNPPLSKMPCWAQFYHCSVKIHINTNPSYHVQVIGCMQKSKVVKVRLIRVIKTQKPPTILLIFQLRDTLLSAGRQETEVLHEGAAASRTVDAKRRPESGSRLLGLRETAMSAPDDHGMSSSHDCGSRRRSSRACQWLLPRQTRWAGS
jgi:hypothetical protein